MTRERQQDGAQGMPEGADRGAQPAGLPAFAVEAAHSGDPDRIAAVLKDTPALRGPMMMLLHRTFGAGFVQSVLDREQHITAAPVMASTPKAAAAANADGPGAVVADPHGPEHDFAGSGDQELLWKRVEPMLTGAAPAAGLAAEVANMDRAHRDRILGRLEDVAKHAGGAAALQIADLVGADVRTKIKTAVSAHPPATAAQLRAHLVALDPADLATALDAAMIATLSAAYPDVTLVLPHVGELGRTVAGNVELVRWLVKSTPPARLAIQMMRIDVTVIPTIAKSLNAIGPDAWTWASHVDAAIAAVGENRASKFAELAPATVGATLLAVAPKVDHESQSGPAPGGAAALTKLVSGSSVDVTAVAAAVMTARTFETAQLVPLQRSPYRERLIAAASFEQLVVVTEALTLMPEVQLEWLLASPHATVEGLRAVASTWSPASVRFSVTPKNLATLQTRFPGVGPADIFGTQTQDLYTRALTDAPIRRWCAKGADPRQLLQLVTQRPGSVALMWRNLVADGVPTGWVHELGTGVDDAALRVLATNCPDRTITKWIREHLLGDLIVEEHASNAVVDIPQVAAETSAQKRLEDGLEHGARDKEIGRRTSELTDVDAARIRANPDELAQVLSGVDEASVSRALFKLQPTATEVLHYADINAVGVATYLRGRAPAETVEAFGEPAIANRVFSRIRSPFTNVPALTDPATLSAVIQRNHDTLRWILRTADARYAIVQLGHPAVATAAGKAFTRETMDLLPTSVSMSAAEVAALDRIAKHVPDKFLASRLLDMGATEEDAEDGDSDVAPAAKPAAELDKTDPQARQHHLDLVLQHGDLEGALDSALMGDPDPFVVLAVCRAHPEGALALFTKPENARRVAKLRLALKDSPIAVFPQVPFHAFLHSAPARQWLFETEPAPVLLTALASPDADITLLAKPLDANDPGVNAWIHALPTGTQLSAHEQRAVRTVFDAVRTNQAARLLFGVRFGAYAATSYTKAELARLWGVLDRLPPSHVAQAAVRSFSEFEEEGGVAGLYSGHAISLREGLLRKDEKHDTYDQGMELTKEQILAAYQIDATQFEARVAQGQFVEKQTPEGVRYEVHEQTQATLDNVVLHEVGHGVDDILGSHNELVYGLAGWREFGESDIPAFAQEFGGWDKVAPADQPRIVEAWQIWFNSTRGDATKGLDGFVGEDHPARAATYKGVGIVDIARQNKPLNAYDMTPVGGKVPVANHGYGKLYRVPVTTMHAAPSVYSMTAPAEFFAECYAEYYRAYDGTPTTNDRKGGRLPGWIKSWFDVHIDKLAFNPSRK